MPRARRIKQPLSGDTIVLMQGDQLHRQKSDLHSARFHVEVALTAAKKANARKRLRSALRIALRGLEADHRTVSKKLEKLNGTAKTR